MFENRMQRQYLGRYLSLIIRVTGVFYALNILVCAFLQCDLWMKSLGLSCLSGCVSLIVLLSKKKIRVPVYLLMSLFASSIVWIIAGKENGNGLRIVFTVFVNIQIIITIKARNEEMEGALAGIGIVLFPISYFVYERYFANRMGLSVQILLFVCFLVLTLNRMNTNTLNEGNAAVRELPYTVNRNNKVMIAVITAVVLFIANIGWVKDQIIKLWQLIRDGLLWLGKMIMSILPEPENGTGGTAGLAQNMEMGPAESAEPSWFALVMEKLIIGVAAIVLLFLLCLIIKKAAKTVPLLLERIKKILNHFSDELKEDYTDEIINTRESGRTSTIAHRLSLKLIRRKLDRTTMSTYVRSGYGRMMDQHPEWSENTTPRDHLEAEKAEIYEKARYSNHLVSTEEAETFFKS